MSFQMNYPSPVIIPELPVIQGARHAFCFKTDLSPLDSERFKY